MSMKQSEGRNQQQRWMFYGGFIKDFNIWASSCNISRKVDPKSRDRDLDLKVVWPQLQRPRGLT